MLQYQDLTDEQWEVLHRLIPEPERREDGRGRPWKGRREVLNGILYILRTRAAWADLPDCYPPYQTCHRRFQQWVRSGVMQSVVEALDEDLRVKGALDTQEAAIDVPVRVGSWPEVRALNSGSDGGTLSPKPTRSATALLEERSRR
jgi:transposase